MDVIGSAYGVVQSAKSKLRSRRNLKRQRCPERQGPRFEVLEQRLYLSGTAAAFATSALADYGTKQPALIMPLEAGTGTPSRGDSSVLTFSDTQSPAAAKAGRTMIDITPGTGTIQASTTTPTQPGTPWVTNIGPTSATINWGASTAESGDAITYDVQYEKPGDWFWSNGPQGVSGTSCSLVGLTIGQQYYVQVQAVGAVPGWLGTSYYYSSWSNEGQFATSNPTPSTPGTPSASNITATSATINWGASSAAGGETTTYTLQYIVQGSLLGWATAPITTGTSVQLTGLNPNTTYDLQVRASDSAGGNTYQSSWSPEGSFSTVAWSYTNFGATANGAAPTTIDNGSTWTMSGESGNVQAGQFCFAYQPISLGSNGYTVTSVVSPPSGGGSAAAGVAVTVGSSYLALYITGAGTLAYSYTSDAGVVTQAVGTNSASAITVPVALAISIDSGGNIYLYYEIQGGPSGDWTWVGTKGPTGSDSFSVPWITSGTATQAGVFVSSGDAQALATASFSSINVNPGFGNSFWQGIGSWLSSTYQGIVTDVRTVTGVLVNPAQAIESQIESALQNTSGTAPTFSQFTNNLGNAIEQQLVGNYSEAQLEEGVGISGDYVWPIIPTTPTPPPVTVAFDFGVAADAKLVFTAGTADLQLSADISATLEGGIGVILPGGGLNVSLTEPQLNSRASNPLDTSANLTFTVSAEAMLDLGFVSADWQYTIGTWTLLSTDSSSGQNSDALLPPQGLGQFTVGFPTATDDKVAVFVGLAGTLDLSGQFDVAFPQFSTAPTATAVQAATATYGQGTTLTADVTPTSGTATVNDGTMTFAVDNSGGQQVETLAPVPVGNGVATVSVPSGLDAGDYTIIATYNPSATNPDFGGSSNSGSLTISPASLTITAGSLTTTYSGQVPSFTEVSPIYSGFVNNDTSASLTTLPSQNIVNASPNAGVYTVQASGGVDPNYDIQYISGKLTIDPAPLTITAANQTIIYGNGPELAVNSQTVFYSGFVDGETAANLTTQATLTSAASSSSNAGTYTDDIHVSGASDANYNITYDYGTLTITPAATKTTVANVSGNYGNSTTLTATIVNILSSAQVNQGAVLFDIMSGSTIVESLTSVAVSDGVASAVVSAGLGAGNYTIDATYNPPTANANFTSSHGTGNLIVAGSAPALLSAESVKAQGSAGTFGINLPLTGRPGIEDRIGGPTQLVLTFQNPIALGSNFSVSLNSGTLGTATVSGDTLTINLSGAMDGQTLVVGINNVQDAATGAVGSYSLDVGVLYGDVDGDGVVNSNDINIIRADSGQNVNSTDFQADLDCDGVINSNDINIARSLSGDTLALPIVEVASAQLETTNSNTLNSPYSSTVNAAAQTLEQPSTISPASTGSIPSPSQADVKPAATIKTDPITTPNLVGPRIPDWNLADGLSTAALMAGEPLLAKLAPVSQFAALPVPTSVARGTKNSVSTEAAKSTPRSELKHGNASRYSVYLQIEPVYSTIISAVPPLMDDDLLQNDLISVPLTDAGLLQFGNWSSSVF